MSVEFTHTIPVQGVHGTEYLDSTVRNSQNNALIDFNNYQQPFGLSNYVPENADSMSTSEKKKYGIEKVPASKSRAAMASNEDIDPQGPVYVDKNFSAKIKKLQLYSHFST